MTAVRTVLVTGASGVLGTAILQELQDGYPLLAGVHQRLPAGDAPVVRVDVTAPQLGLDPAGYRRLCAQVDVVVHSAAIVNFSADSAEVDRVNVEGLGRVVEFAAEAGALLVHVSTAFVARHDGARELASKSTARPDEYVRSKHTGEEIVRSSGIEALIVRPSVLIGHSVTGEIRQGQGVHALGEAILLGTLPFVPAVPGSLIDIVSTDVVGRGVRALLDADVRAGEFWMTAGANALPVARFVELTTEEGEKAGRDVLPVRLVKPSMVERLIRPGFADVLPPEEMGRLDGLLAVCSLVMADTTMPTSFDAVPGGPAPLTRDDVEQAWRVSARRLIQDLESPSGARPGLLSA